MRYIQPIRNLVSTASLLALFSLSGSLNAATVYTWTGAVDGDWNNAANWDGNGVPVDSQTSGNYHEGLNFANNSGDSIIFDGLIAPTTNIAGLGGGFNPTSDTPILNFNRGGSFTFAMSARDGGTWSTSASTTYNIWTIGDGVGGGIENVDVTISGLQWINRNDQSTTVEVVVNSDGTLRLDTDFRFSNTDSRPAKFTVAGGGIEISAAALDLGQFAGDTVDFTVAGGYFTANYGGNLADFDDVTSAGIWETGTGVSLEFTDHGTFYTVAAIPEVNSVALCIGGLGTLLIGRRRR